MKITGMTDGVHKIIFLNTWGRPPEEKELALFFCRSITVLGEYYLAGPGPRGEYLAFDVEGNRLPLGPVHRDVLLHRERYVPMELPPLETLLALRESKMEG